MIVQGSSVILYAVVTDDVGSVINTGVTMILRAPDGTETSPTVTFHSAATTDLPANRWDCTVTLSQGGVYHLRWVSASPVGAFEQPVPVKTTRV